MDPIARHPARHELYLATEAEGARLGSHLAQRLHAGDTLLLSGPVGAGKSHLCRAVIRQMVGADIDVPSPTFTLVQTYEAEAGEIWHADLYRLSDPSEAEELGLLDAMQNAVVLIEWPDRLGADRPEQALEITLSYEGEGRRMQLSGPQEMLSRLIGGFSA